MDVIHSSAVSITPEISKVKQGASSFLLAQESKTEHRSVSVAAICISLKSHTVMEMEDYLPCCRGFDPVAPVIHEWTYEAMAYDLLGLDNGTFRYTAETGVGSKQVEVVLSDKDELWSRLRHRFIADVQRETSELSASLQKKKAGKFEVRAARPGQGQGPPCSQCSQCSYPSLVVDRLQVVPGRLASSLCMPGLNEIGQRCAS